ncbi:MAG: hypothetical protein ACJAYU_004496 [Bradymonadia bacterium]|jgi:hypothetical protein
MSQLGSIFEKTEGTKGEDLRHHVEASRGEAASATGALVRVPLKLADENGHVHQRRRNPADDGDTLTVRLPTDSPSPVMVRLRGMGAENESGSAGDLYLTVTLVEGGPLVRIPPAGTLARVAPIAVIALILVLVAVVCGA